MEIIQEWGTVFFVMAVIFGFYMTWGIGANDVANAMGVSVGSGAITVKQAIIIAAVFEFAGAFIAGGAVTKTIRKGIIDPEPLAANPETDSVLRDRSAHGLFLELRRRGFPQ